MSSLNQIYNKLGLLPKIEEEKEKFCNRVIQLMKNLDSQDTNKNFLKRFLVISGIKNHSSLEYCFDEGTFENYILYLNYILYMISQNEELPSNKQFNPGIINLCKKGIETIFKLTLLNLGYLYKGNYIIKSGAKELDEKLIIDNLDWLIDFPNVRKNFKKAVEFNESKNYEDCLTNAYSALENIVKIVLDNKKILHNNKQINAFLKKINLGQWNNIIKNFCDIANNFSSRHGNEKEKTNTKIKLTPELAEFYLYMTGSFIRLITQTIKENEKN